MRSKMVRILSILTISSLSACATTTPEVVPVIIPPKPYSGTLTLSDAMQCEEGARKNVFRHLKARDIYIDTLIAVMKAHNGSGQ